MKLKGNLNLQQTMSLGNLNEDESNNKRIDSEVMKTLVSQNSDDNDNTSPSKTHQRLTKNKLSKTKLRITT